MNIRSLLTVVFIAFISCNNQKDLNRSIVINNCETVTDSYYLEDITKSWKAVYLENSSINTMIGNVRQVLCDDSLIFVSHKSSSVSKDEKIYIFNHNGKFIRQITNIGRAKNEYISIGAWTLDAYNKELVIFDCFDCIIKRYNYNGEFLGSSQLDYSLQQISRIMILNKDLYLFKLSITDKISDDYILFNHKSGTLEEIFQKRNIYTEDFILTRYNCHVNPGNKYKNIKRDYDNTIFTIDSCCNFTSNDYNLDFMPKANPKDLKKLSQNSKDRPEDHIISMYDFSDYILLHTFSGYYFIDKKSSKITQYIGDGTVIDDIVPATNNKVGIHNNNLIAVIYPNFAESVLNYVRETQREEVIEFYKKAAANENATLVFYEIGK